MDLNSRIVFNYLSRLSSLGSCCWEPLINYPSIALVLSAFGSSFDIERRLKMITIKRLLHFGLSGVHLSLQLCLIDCCHVDSVSNSHFVF